MTKMWYFLCAFFVYNLASLPSSDAARAKSVNMNLETVLEFDERNLASDVQLIDNVQSFLSKVRKILDHSDDENARRSSDGKKQLKMIDFLRNAVLIIKSYSDEELTQLLHITDDELRKYHYKGCKFHELVQREKVRSYVSETLNELRSTPLKRVRRYLERVLTKLQNKDFNLIEKRIIDFVDSLYPPTAAENMFNLLRDLEEYRNKKIGDSREHYVPEVDLKKTVRAGIRSLLFDRYSQLNANVRRDLQNKVAALLGDFSEHDKIDTLLIETDDLTTDKAKKEKIGNDKPSSSSPKESKKNDRNDNPSVETKINSDNDITKEETKQHGGDHDWIENKKARNNDDVSEEKKLAPKKERTTESVVKRHTKRVKSRMHKNHPVSVLPEDVTVKTRKRVHTPKRRSHRRGAATAQSIIKESEHRPRKHVAKRKDSSVTINLKDYEVPTSERKKKTIKKKHIRKHKDIQAESDRDDVSEMRVQTEALKLADKPKSRAKQEEDDGMPIESFELNDLKDHFKFRRRSFEFKNERSNKRKEEVLRRKLDEAKTESKTIPDSSILMNRIKNLEKQIELMKHKIDDNNNDVKKIIHNAPFIPLKNIPEIKIKQALQYSELPHWTRKDYTTKPSITTTPTTTTTTTEKTTTANIDANYYDDTANENEVTITTEMTPKFGTNSRKLTSNSVKIKTTITEPLITASEIVFEDQEDNNTTESKTVFLSENSLNFNATNVARKLKAEVKLEDIENNRIDATSKQTETPTTEKVTKISTVDKTTTPMNFRVPLLNYSVKNNGNGTMKTTNGVDSKITIAKMKSEEMVT